MTEVARSRPAPDQEHRERAIAERGRNLLIDAGAGTGKTTILVERLVEMVAPSRGGAAVPIARIAAITFTRKAAGELRLRIRERLLQELAEAEIGSRRGAELRDAIAGLDTAHIGTIHGFADRLLRLRPVEAELSPSYETTDDEEPLIDETFGILMQAVESRTLAEELEGSDAAGRADEVIATVLDALRTGLRSASRETEWKTHYGLDALVAGFIRGRDMSPPEDTPAVFDAASFRAAAREFVRLAGPVRNGSPGADWIVRTAGVLRRLLECDDPLEISRELRRQLRRAPRNRVTKRDTFAGDGDAWKVWKAFIGTERGRDTPLRDELRAPCDRWLATRLARLFPVVVALYEKVKARHRQLDQLDLLLKLRDLLAKDKDARREYQRMFDHVFVDEFQDTDPLQAEVVLYLCEREPRADRWEDVVLASDKLTLVGDPKQSIYRFRRADIAMYDRVQRIVRREPHLDVALSANFRSVPALIEWTNACFARVLGTSPDGESFDPSTGTVFHQVLDAGRKGAPSPGVWILPFDFRDGGRHGADEYRQLEGRAVASYLRWLVESSDVEIIDPLDGHARRVRYGDIAVLAVSTWNLSMLFSCLDVRDIPYASRGGRLFLEDPLHRQFLLGLRALADRDDGVAEAALLRPPFFAVDPVDLLRARKDDEDPGDERAARAREARDVIRELRRRRFERAPGVTARDLLDRTAFARAAALGPNGAQRLRRLRELCLILEHVADAEGLDYDAVTARLRDWALAPAQIDPPPPVGTEAVQVMTVHQAKGLEFPVVIFWDGKGQWRTRPQDAPWRMERDGRGWMMDLDKLTWEEPAGTGIRKTELDYLDAERRRVVYVAATRARDMLVIPKAGHVPAGRYICGDLLEKPPEKVVRIVDVFFDGEEPPWARSMSMPRDPPAGDAADIERRANERWAACSRKAARPRFRPASVSGEARAVPAEEVDGPLETRPVEPDEGRFGGLFGSVVHHAIGLVLRKSPPTSEEAARRAAMRYGLAEHLEEAADDVERALRALREENLARPPDDTLQLEYPIAGPWEGGRLMSGYVDLVAFEDGQADIVDFKTDAPPQGPVEQAYPRYVEQVRAYARLLEGAGVIGDRRVRCGLLFTGDGAMRWVEG